MVVTTRRISGDYVKGPRQVTRTRISGDYIKSPLRTGYCPTRTHSYVGSSCHAGRVYTPVRLNTMTGEEFALCLGIMCLFIATAVIIDQLAAQNRLHIPAAKPICHVQEICEDLPLGFARCHLEEICYH